MERQTDEPRYPRWVHYINTGSRVFAIVAGSALLLMAINVIANVVGRIVFHAPVPGTVTVVAHLWMVTVVFLGMSYAQLRGEHIQATILTERLPHRTRRIVVSVNLVFLAVIVAIIGYYGLFAAIESAAIQEAVPGSFSLPIWQMRFLVPLGALMLVLQSIVSIRSVLNGGDELKTGDEKESLR